LASPVIKYYEGCLLFKIDLTNGVIARSADGVPEILLTFEKPSDAIQTGVCTYDPGLTKTGIIIGDVVIGSKPQFKLFSTGVVPKYL
jgi:hypothetical protein